MNHVPCAYVAQELLDCPALHGSTWQQAHSQGERANFLHPYEYFLFLGKDNHGDYIPSVELRTAYGQQRRDVYPMRAEDSDEGLGGSGDSEPGRGSQPGGRPSQ
jgi:hypothetical protein